MADRSSLIDYSKSGGIARITIERADKLNALDAGMVAQLNRVCLEIDSDPSVRIALLSAAGDRAFSAGGDIKAWGDLTPQEFARDWLRRGHDAFNTLARLRVPLIAVLCGDVLGGGLELAATADLRIAEDHIRFGQPEAGIGIIPGWSGTQRAVRRFGAGPVRRMALFGEILSAEQALAAGIVDHLVEKGAGMAKAESIAATVLSRGPAATAAIKMLINAAEGEERESAIETLAGLAVSQSGEPAKGVDAFRKKQKPEF